MSSRNSTQSCKHPNPTSLVLTSRITGENSVKPWPEVPSYQGIIYHHTIKFLHLSSRYLDCPLHRNLSLGKALQAISLVHEIYQLQVIANFCLSAEQGADILYTREAQLFLDVRHTWNLFAQVAHMICRVVRAEKKSKGKNQILGKIRIHCCFFPGILARRSPSRTTT